MNDAYHYVAPNIRSNRMSSHTTFTPSSMGQQQGLQQSLQEQQSQSDQQGSHVRFDGVSYHPDTYYEDHQQKDGGDVSSHKTLIICVAIIVVVLIITIAFMVSHRDAMQQGQQKMKIRPPDPIQYVHPNQQGSQVQQGSYVSQSQPYTMVGGEDNKTSDRDMMLAKQHRQRMKQNNTHDTTDEDEFLEMRKTRKDRKTTKPADDE